MDATEGKTLGEAIKELRERRGWSQVKLADVSGVGYATISRLENNRVKTYPWTLEQLAAALGVEAIYLMRLAGLTEEDDAADGLTAELQWLMREAQAVMGELPAELSEDMLKELRLTVEARKRFARYVTRDSEEGAERRDAPGETDRIDSLILRELRQLRQESEAEYQARIDALRSLIAEHESRINQQDAPGER